MSFLGHDVEFTWTSNSVVTTQTKTVDGNVEFSITPVSFPITFDLSSDEIVQAFGGLGLGTGAANSFSFRDVASTIPSIVNAAAKSVTPGNTAPDVTFSADEVTLAFPSGFDFNSGVNYVVDVDFAGATVTAADDPFTVFENETSSFNVIANDSHSEADGLAVVEVNGVAGNVGVAVAGSNGGTFTIAADGSLLFDPGTDFDDLAAGQSRVTTIAYRARDDNFAAGPSDTATVTITVNGVNDPPSAGEDSFTTADDVSPFAGSLLANDTDIDNALTVSAVNGSAAAVGSTITLASGALLKVNADGTFVFDPYGVHQHLAVGGTAIETFTYTVSDGTLTDTATVTLTVTGADNNDTFTGTASNDTIDAGRGNDTVKGRAGNDILIGGFDDDSLDGGSGNDRLFGDGGKDHLVGGAGDDVLDGGTNDDLIEGNAGNDRLIGGANNDTLIGGSGKDRLQGDAGQDRLEGGAGNDTLDGGTNKDTLIGGTGRDLLTGGSSADTFVFASINDSAPNIDGHSGGVYSAAKGAGVRDIILDFAVGLDKIDVSGIDADRQRAGNQTFAWIASDDFSGDGAELRFTRFNEAGTDHDRTIVYGDVDGDGKSEFQIEIRGLKALTAADFHL